MYVEVTEAWLAQLNERFRRQDVPAGKRPWLAWAELSKTEERVDGEDPRVQRIFAWFDANTKPGSQQVGPAFVGAFYFDSAFWPLSVPMVFGRGKIDVLRCLQLMSNSLKEVIVSDAEALANLRETWAACADYAYGRMDIWRRERDGVFQSSSFCMGMLTSAHRQLEGCVSMLLNDRPNPASVEHARMATEMFLKAYLAANMRFGDKESRRLGHDLEKIVDTCIALRPGDPDLVRMRARVPVFPPVKARYEGTKRAAKELWQTYSVCQSTAGLVVRALARRAPAQLRVTSQDTQPSKL